MGMETTRSLFCVILTRSYLHFCEKMIRLLQRYDIKPILVFDGESLPAKKQEDEERRASALSKPVMRRRRTKKHEEGKALVAQGKQKEAMQMFTQSLTVSKEMIKQFILLLIRMRIPIHHCSLRGRRRDCLSLADGHRGCGDQRGLGHTMLPLPVHAIQAER